MKEIENDAKDFQFEFIASINERENICIAYGLGRGKKWLSFDNLKPKKKTNMKIVLCGLDNRLYMKEWRVTTCVCVNYAVPDPRTR